MERRSTAYSLQGVYCAVVWLSIVARLAGPCLVLTDVIQGWVLDLRNAHELRLGDGGLCPPSVDTGRRCQALTVSAWTGLGDVWRVVPGLRLPLRVNPG